MRRKAPALHEKVSWCSADVHHTLAWFALACRLPVCVPCLNTFRGVVAALVLVVGALAPHLEIKLVESGRHLLHHS